MVPILRRASSCLFQQTAWGAGYPTDIPVLLLSRRELIPWYFLYVRTFGFKNKIGRRRRQNSTHFLSCASADSLRCWLSDRCSSLALLSSSVSRANLSCVVATIFSSLAFLSKQLHTNCISLYGVRVVLRQFLCMQHACDMDEICV